MNVAAGSSDKGGQKVAGQYEIPLTQSGEVAHEYHVLDDSYTPEPGKTSDNTLTFELTSGQTTSFYEDPDLVRSSIQVLWHERRFLAISICSIYLCCMI